MNMETTLVILSVALLVLVAFLIPILIRVWLMTRELGDTLKTINARLPDILKNVDEISANINASTTAVNREVQQYAATADRVHRVVDRVADGLEWISPLVARPPVLRRLSQGMALVKGAGAFFRVLTEKKKA